MSKGTIVSLCDLTGIMVSPWVKAGYRAVLVDPQHESGVNTDGLITRIGRVIDHAETWKYLSGLDDVVFVAGFPPCTDVAVSGAAHFQSKREKDQHFQAKAALIAEQCRGIGNMFQAPWFFENPVSVFSSIFGPPDFTFHPYEYGGYLPVDDAHPSYPEYIAPRDAYPKKTCLWAGCGFLMPKKIPVDFGGGYSAQHLKLGGKSERTKNIRSATARGFSEAVFLFNAPHLKQLVA